MACEQLTELLGYVRDGFPPGHRFGRLRLANVSDRSGPQPWLLGSSPQSGIWAAEFGLPYAFADFIYPGGAVVARQYRESFQPSARLSSPYVIVAAWALCADTNEEASHLAASSRMAFAHFLAGDPIPVPPIDTALEFLARHPERLAAVAQRLLHPARAVEAPQVGPIEGDALVPDEVVGHGEATGRSRAKSLRLVFFG